MDERDDAIALVWDAANVSHLSRHGVTRLEVEQVLRNSPFDVEYQDVEGEPRWLSLGHTDALRVLFIVWTLRGDAVRVATAYPASRTVRKTYFQQRGM
ncbi:MAG: BrnT family toxin [Acidobacteria bacterium]|nr:BrnT family toxin [Acidobacteriota bacterium]